MMCSRCDAPLVETRRGTFTCDPHGAFVTARAMRSELALPAADEGGPTVRCAGCADTMRAVDLPPAQLDRCPSCGGWWVDRGEIERVRAHAVARHEHLESRYRFLLGLFRLG